jgi:glycosyltransferase involved in cell wall biosynthesis
MATYNGAATLPKVLEAYCALAAPPDGWQLIIIDNGSTDASSDIAAGFAERLPLQLLHEPRRGKNAALNTGLRHALRHFATTLLVFSDDDTRPDADWLLNLAACAAAQPGYDVFGGSILPDWAVEPPAWILKLVPLGLTFGLTASTLEQGPVFPGLVWGANMAVQRRVFDAGQHFDEHIGPNGADYAMGSETEFTRRVHALGFRSWFCPSARVAHHIRAHQLSERYVLQRAGRFGRGKARQDQPGVFPEIMGMPRWMLSRMLQEACGWLAATLLRRRERLFLHRWELAYLRGYLREARTRNVDSRRTVLITSHSGELGGMELRMAQEARFLAASGIRSPLALRRFSGFDAWAQRLASEGISVSEFAPPLFFEQWERRRWNKLKSQLLAAPRLRAYRPDLVHVALCWTTYGASVLWLAQRCGLPAVLSVHNAFPPAEISAWHQPLLRQAFRSIKGIYAVSESAMAHFMQVFRHYVPNEARLAVIPNCVDTQRFVPSPSRGVAARACWGVPEDALVIGTVGRLSEQKRPALLLALHNLLVRRFPNIYLVFIGGGPLEDALRDAARQSARPQQVIFAGFVSGVEQVLPAFDLHVLLSRNEGFGIATIEAMACGVPAVATDVPGSADILRGSPSGLLVPPDDVAAAAELIAPLLADPARRAQMGRAGRAEAEARYSHAVVGPMVRNFYDGLV